jgi:hypothetical protein
VRLLTFFANGEYEHSEKVRAPHTHGPRDVPRCGILRLQQKPLHYKRGFSRKSTQLLCTWALAKSLPPPAFNSKLLDRGVQAVVRGGARCALHVLGRSANADACGRTEKWLQRARR